MGLGDAPLALTTDAPGAAHQMKVGVTSEIHPGSVQSWEVPTRQENLPIFQGQIRLGADSDTAAGRVHICPGAVGQALAHLGPHHLALPPAHILNLIVHGQEVDSLHLVPSQAPVPDAPFPGRVYDLATWGVSPQGERNRRMVGGGGEGAGTKRQSQEPEAGECRAGSRGQVEDSAGMRCWRVGEGRSRKPWAKGHSGMGQG